ncbi:MAG TPA: class I SAM-dependent methyltransferase [Caulobacteraceae bacterium]|nr:class I SAM-dependent methyltransferase [Caulobacteraceae bacterium]
MTTPPNLRPEAFAGTAEAYLRWRPAYPASLLGDLVARAAPPPTGAVLVDLACGPGRVALDLAAAFETVIAVDLEPEMVAVGRREAERRGVAHVEWRVGGAEDLELAPTSVDLVTVGEAFHRLDQGRVAARALAWLKPGGGFATLGTEGLLDGREPWQRTVAETARAFMPEGWVQAAPGAEPAVEGFERVLRAAGFEAVASQDFSEPHAWSLAAILGYLSSTSVCSPGALAGRRGDFEASVRRALLTEHGAGPFHETLRAGYTLGRKPRD